jgi:hypothetical protein
MTNLFLIPPFVWGALYPISNLAFSCVPTPKEP